MKSERIFYLTKILKEETDANHSLTLNEILDKLNNRYPELRAKENAIRSDLSLLQYLCDTQVLPFSFTQQIGFHNQFHYSLTLPKFGLTEARLVSDSVSASAFLSEKQKKELLEPLGMVLSHYEVRQLRQRLQTRLCLQPAPHLPENLSKLYQSIEENHLVSFDYYKFDLQGHPQKQKHYTQIQPVRVVWSDARHYLYALNWEHAPNNQQRCYRVDRMQNLAVLEEKGHPFDMEQLHFGQFDIFSYEKTQRVWFRIDRDLWDMVLERFHRNITAREDPERPGKICFDTTVALSKGFYRWVLKQGPRIEVLAPASVRAEVRRQLEDALKQYSDIDSFFSSSKNEELNRYTEIDTPIA